MSLLVSWLIFPLVLGVLSLGCGLLVERAAGCRVQRELVLPLGFATIVVASLFTTASSRTAHLTTPLVVGLAVAGLGLALPVAAAAGGRLGGGWRRPVLRRVRRARVPLGQPTFAGYIKLDDTSTWLAFTDRLLEHGRELDRPRALHVRGDAEVQPERRLPGRRRSRRSASCTSSSGTDSAWLFQPYVAFLAAMLALGDLRRPRRA